MQGVNKNRKYEVSRLLRTDLIDYMDKAFMRFHVLVK